MNEDNQLQTLLRQYHNAKVRSVAGFVLGSRPKKQQRKWTGWVQGHHLWRGRGVVLPDERVAEVYGAVRGQVIVRWHDPFEITQMKVAVYQSSELTIHKLPAAVALGRAKRGVRERPSAIKALKSRLNGSMPPRPGSRPRGRPRKFQLPGSM